MIKSVASPNVWMVATVLKDCGTMKDGAYRKASVRVIMEVFITHMQPKENRRARNGKSKLLNHMYTLRTIKK